MATVEIDQPAMGESGKIKHKNNCSSGWKTSLVFANPTRSIFATGQRKNTNKCCS